MRKKGIDPELAAAVLTQSRLRAKAATKFGELAAGMLFTPAGLEQATRLPVAAQHAQRYRQANLRHIADLTCRSEEHTSELQSRGHLVCRLLLEKKNTNVKHVHHQQ